MSNSLNYIIFKELAAAALENLLCHPHQCLAANVGLCDGERWGMTDDMSSKIGELLEARSAKKAEVERAKREIEAGRQNNLKAFLTLQESIIRPALEDFAATVSDHGGYTSIYEVKDQEFDGIPSYRASIGIRFLLNGPYGDSTYAPYFAMQVDKLVGKVDIFCSNAPGGSSSPGFAGSMEFSEVNLEQIKAMLFKAFVDIYDEKK
jgi:hypothetical protein